MSESNKLNQAIELSDTELDAIAGGGLFTGAFRLGENLGAAIDKNGGYDANIFDVAKDTLNASNPYLNPSKVGFWATP